MSKGHSEAVDCEIAVFTPLSSLYSLIDSTMFYYPLFVLMIFTVIFLKTFIAMKFFIKPVERFISLLTGWDPAVTVNPLNLIFII